MKADKAGKATKAPKPGDVKILREHYTDPGVKANKAIFEALQEKLKQKRLSKTNLKKMETAEENAALTLEAKIKKVRESKDW